MKEPPIARGLADPGVTDVDASPVPLSDDHKVIEGKDGWLFLANDSHYVLEQHRGARRLTDAQLDDWAELMEARTDLVASVGGHYVALVAPDTHAVYPDKLPDSVVPAAERPIHQLIDRLRGSRARFVYPLDELLAARAAQTVGSQGDSHLNHRGAFILYNRLMDELQNVVPILRLSEPEDVAFYEVDTGGDLARKVAITAPRVLGEVRWPGARLCHDNLIEGTGTMIATECPDAAGVSCLLFGDSYSYDVIKFLAETFRRFTFVHSVNFGRALVLDERPDVVISLTAERFLIQVPDDDAGENVLERARVKRELGRTRQNAWFWPRSSSPIPSIRAVERIRATLLDAGRPYDAALVTTLAYAGLRPDELKRLLWTDLRDGQLIIRDAWPDAGQLDLGPARAVQLLRPLAADLNRWQEESGSHDGLVFPGPGGADWKKGDWLRWRQEAFQPAARFRGPVTRPYDLHYVFLILMIDGGAGPVEVARQSGYTPDTMRELYEFRLQVIERCGPCSPERRIEYVRAV